MDREEHTIYENLIKDENSLIEALLNNFKIKSFRDAFLENIKLDWIEKDEIVFEDFESQRRLKGGDFGQPDLSITTQSIEILIEIKVYDTQTTDKQPSGYLKYLNESNKDHKALIFLVPEGYFKTREITKKFDNSRIDCDKVIITWHSLINLIINKELNKYHLLLNEFFSFLSNWFLSSRQVLTRHETRDMYSKDFASGFEKILRVIDNVENDLKKQGLKTTNSRKKYLDEYGFYIQSDVGENVIFFGIWMDYWKSTGNPLIIGLESELLKIRTLFYKAFKIPRFDLDSFKIDGDTYELFFINKEIIESEEGEEKIVQVISKFMQRV